VNEGSTAETIVDNFRKDRVLDKLPDTKVIFTSINRAPQKKARWKIVDEANAEVRAYAGRNGRVIYVELNTALFDESGNPRLDLYQDDQLHFKSRACEEFTKIIKPVLQEVWYKQ